jgi:hypothetical protein
MATTTDDTATLGISIPGVPRPDPVADVSDVETMIARNLRQASSCGKNHIRKLLDAPDPEAEMELAKLVADSGCRGLRENIASLAAQLAAEARISELRRRAVETAASNPYTTPAQYPAALREILTSALGRPY